MQDSLHNQQEQLKSVGCEGDTLIVTRLDRLGRRTLDKLKTLQSIDEKGGRVQGLDFDLDTKIPAEKLVTSVIASLAQWERELC
ncbi:MAG TPA: hypothetical protein DIS77_00285 [Rothia sp.]|nr:hypothetical protein [Rothia sp. (in: high G+C Gram-positive bacteria)]